MNIKSKSFEDLSTIRKIMEDSSRFLSLSGLSGLFAGLIAICGAVIAYFVIFDGNILLDNEYLTGLTSEKAGIIRYSLLIDSLLVLSAAVGVSFFFSYRKSVRKQLKMWTPVSKRLLTTMLVPLISGGIFILILINESQWQLIVPSMLVFYGLSLASAGKFTYNEIFYLGLIEILIGLISALFPVFGLIFWCLGFGLLHIAYGLLMYRKYEK